MRITMRTEGFAELDARLKQLSRAGGKGALRRAGITALIPTAEKSRGLVRRDTDELADSITVSAKAFGGGLSADAKAAFAGALKDGKGKAAAVQALRDARRGDGPGPASVQLFMGPAHKKSKAFAIKAMVNEVGSSTMSAQSYLRAALDADKTAILDRLRVALAVEIDKAIARAARRAARRDARGA